MLNFKKGTVIAVGAFAIAFTCSADSNMGSAGQMEEQVAGAPESQKTESEYFLGVIGGVNSPLSSRMNSSADGGVAIAFQPGASFGVGAQVTTSELKDENRNQRTVALLQTAYRIGGDTPVLKGMFLGVGGGPVFISSKSVEWAVAPVVGVDIPLSSKAHDIVSIGLDAKFVGITNSADSYVGSAAIKYWY
jgi:hypothetical protein